MTSASIRGRAAVAWAAVAMTAILAAATIFAGAVGCRGLGSSAGGGDVRITYTSAGGIVGGLEKTEIAGDGRILITSKGKTSGERNLSVSPEEIAALVKVLEDAGFFDMNDKYAPDRPVPDMMSESVQYRDDTRSKTVTVISGGEVPKGWDRVIAAIKKLKS